MRNSLIGKPKNWLDGLYKRVKPYEKLEIIKEEDLTPKTPTRLMSKKQIAEAIESMREAIKPNGKAIWLTIDGAYEIDYNYNPPRVTEIKQGERMNYRWEAIIALVIGVMWQIVAIVVIKNGGDGMLQVIAGALFMILGEIRLHRRW